MQLIERIRAGESREICATHDALTAFERAREQAARHTVWVTGCRSWYLDDRGLPAVWPWSFTQFRKEMQTPNLTAYELT
jgi:hypothetical protein